MSQPGYGAETDQLKVAVGQLRDAGEDLRSRMTGLEGACQEVLASGWVGGAADAFRQLIGVLTTEGKDLHKWIDEISRAVGGAHDNYQAQEAEHSETMKKIANETGAIAQGLKG